MPGWTSRKLLRYEIRTWLLVGLVAAVGYVAWGVFFVRRQIHKYRPSHSFSIASPEFFGTAHALADPLPVEGNRIDLLQNGDEIFPAMLAALHSARHSINFEAYILYSDGTGRSFRDALIERARAGVTVRVLLDGIGSSTRLDNHDVALLKEGGCHFAYYHPTLSLRLDRANRRSHRRILVIDGRLGFTGGVGFADEWAGHAEDPRHWRDLQLRVQGPLVAKLQGAFQQHWIKETEKALQGEAEFPALPPAGGLKAQMTASHSYSTAALPLVQAVAMAAAEKRIWITNAYCTPTEDQVELLQTAVRRGVDVRLLVPGEHNDQPMTKTIGRTAYGQLLRGGVKIFEFQPTMIHQKTMVMDGRFAILGSSNFDARSSQLNEEVDLTVYDEAFGRQMESVFQNDLRQARPYTLEDFQRRTTWERVTEWALQPFRSQL